MSLDPHSMVTDLGSLEGLFKSNVNFTVPRFQRDYDWSIDQIEEFWDDLLNHYDDWKNNRDQIQYYFGSLMLVRDDQIPTRFSLVDGQQRLTTCLVFFIALRDFFLEHGMQDDVDGLNKILYYENKNKELEPRLRLNRYNDPFFKNKIIEEKPISEKSQSFPKRIRVDDKGLKNCYDFFSEKLISTKKDEAAFFDEPLEARVEIFRDLYEHLLDHFEIVQNVFDNKQRAYRIFEAINHKGLRLSENDLVKNYIFELIDDTKSIEETQELISADDQWQRIVNKLKTVKISEDKCLRAHLTAHQGKTPKAKIFEKITEIVKSKAQAQKFLNELEESSLFLSELKIPTPAYWNLDQEILDNLIGYSAISDGGMYPILLIANKKFGDEVKSQNLKKLIELITKLHFRAKTICGISFTKIEPLVVEICKIIRDSVSDPMSEIQQEILKWSGYPEPDEFKIKFKEFSTRSDRTAKYALKELEYKKIGGRKNSSTQIIEDIEVEHIMPQSIEEWVEDLKKIPELKEGGFQLKDYHDRNLYKLGNLTLLAPTPNKINSNHVFQKKLHGVGEKYLGYREDQIKITSSLTEYSKWTESEIQLRQEHFLQDAEIIWDLN